MADFYPNSSDLMTDTSALFSDLVEPQSVNNKFNLII